MKKVHARAGRADHLGQHFLTDFRHHVLGLVLLAEMRELEESASQPFLAGVEELVDEIRLDAGVAGEQERNEDVGEGVLFVQHAEHLLLLDSQHRGAGERGGTGHPESLGGGDALFADEVAGLKQGERRFFPALRQDGQLDASPFE